MTTSSPKFVVEDEIVVARAAAQLVVAGAAVEVVVALAAEQIVLAAATVEIVAAAVAKQVIGTLFSVGRILAAAAVDQVRPNAADEIIVAIVAEKIVVAVAAGQVVVAFVAMEVVVTVAAVLGVVSVIAVDMIVAPAGGDVVVSRRSVQVVVVVTGKDIVAAVARITVVVVFALVLALEIDFVEDVGDREGQAVNIGDSAVGIGDDDVGDRSGRGEFTVGRKARAFQRDRVAVELFGGRQERPQHIGVCPDDESLFEEVFKVFQFEHAFGHDLFSSLSPDLLAQTAGSIRGRICQPPAFRWLTTGEGQPSGGVCRGRG